MSNKKVPLKKNSLEEIEIRANTIEVVRELSEFTGINQRKINDYLWLMAQDLSLKLEKDFKYHRVKTINY
jgi:predicted solute-binding protein